MIFCPYPFSFSEERSFLFIFWKLQRLFAAILYFLIAPNLGCSALASYIQTLTKRRECSSYSGEKRKTKRMGNQAWDGTQKKKKKKNRKKKKKKKKKKKNQSINK